MTHIAVIGCGVVGAAIAYELSQVPGLQITVFDRQAPAQASTGAALGVLMGVISQKVKGRAWELRSTSIRRYETLVPELERLTGKVIPFNRQGILKLCPLNTDLATWEALVEVRRHQGWYLEILTRQQLQAQYPQLNREALAAAIYSPQDRQLDPTALTWALIEGARQNGVQFQFNQAVTQLQGQASAIQQVCTDAGPIAVDWVVITAGIGTLPLTQLLNQPIDIRPVLGQAIEMQLDQSLGHPHLQPVITGNDVHIVPVGQNRYWVGATVEFGQNGEPPVAEPELLEAVRQQAIAFCPALAQGTILRTWSGLRPRPEGRHAPIIEPLAGYTNVLLATGHYRNGVLLAPATAIAIRQAIVAA